MINNLYCDTNLFLTNDNSFKKIMNVKEISRCQKKLQK